MSSLRDELKEGFARTHERLDEMNARIASLEATRAHATGWVQGAKWLGGALLAGALWVLGRVWPVVFVFVLGSCYEALPVAADLDRPAGAQGRWFEDDRPVTLVLEHMPLHCKPAAYQAIADWRVWSPRTFGDVIEQRPPVVPRMGEIAFVVRPRESPTSTLADLTQPYGRGDRLTRALATIYEPWCTDPRVWRHAIGHALGLGDTENPGHVMNGVVPAMGVQLTVEEYEWVH